MSRRAEVYLESQKQAVSTSGATLTRTSSLEYGNINKGGVTQVKYQGEDQLVRVDELIGRGVYMQLINVDHGDSGKIHVKISLNCLEEARKSFGTDEYLLLVKTVNILLQNIYADWTQLATEKHLSLFSDRKAYVAVQRQNSDRLFCAD
ncbi:hypothetical protein Syun_004735 [Stephania yunnanensis]|uniref:Uncharacterized protein n=1 Tax=Stephania yunnanensis TaxID=152371 RepID=A0AAP0L508_9MAGN